MAKRTIEEIYNIICEKRDNAERDWERWFYKEDRLMMEKCYSEAQAYTDVLILIETSEVLEDER